MIHVSIKREECTACSTCWDTCPEVFEENGDDRFSQIRENTAQAGGYPKGRCPTT